jgi:hypothetical protein
MWAVHVEVSIPVVETAISVAEAVPKMTVGLSSCLL